MSSSTRANHTRQQSSISISKPMPISPHTVSPPTSPNKTKKTKSRRPSVSSPMTWLSRTSSTTSIQSATPYAPSRPVRISEPRFANPVEAMTIPRSGVLGKGATIVRTPQEALAGSRAFASSPDLLSRVRSPTPVREYDEEEEHMPGSPPLPPIPNDDSEYIEEEPLEADVEDPQAVSESDWHPPSLSDAPHPPPPTRPPPSLPSASGVHSHITPLRPMSPLRSHRGISPLDSFPPVPPLPASAVQTPPQAPFSAILVSPAPSSCMDPCQIIVSLETSTETHRTTMSTLTSRPSHLASYLLGLLPSSESDSHSVYSTRSDVDSSFDSIFHHHLASSGVLQTSTNLHVFLDRPSAPYAHILTYLRSPATTSEHQTTLPHAVRLNGSSLRLEALLELRNEASYLGLNELHKLCLDELRHRQPSPNLAALGLHMRGFSNASSKSLHTLRETLESDHDVQRHSGDSGFASNSGAARRSGGSSELEAPWPSPPTLKQRSALQEGSPNKDKGTTSVRPTGAWI